VLLSLMLGAFIPYQVILYPLVRIFSSVDLYGTLPGIVLIHIIFGLPYMTLLFFNFYQGVPPELSKAAKMDGAGFFTIFFQIMLPMSVNVLVVAIIMQATGIWNDFLLGLIFAGRDHLPITVQLNNIVNTTTGVKEYNVNMAATFLTALPPLLIYIVSGRYFARGLAAGAVKG
jgi:glucose/mannose transport system permease protein